MAEMLLINPRKRRATRKTARKTIAKSRHSMARRKNPIAAIRRRRAHPMTAKRRRNPISMGGMAGGYMTAIREALMGGAGAVAMEVVFGQVNKFLPATLQKTPGTIGAGDAVKAILTVFMGQALNGATRGFSKKAAQASLTVQAHDIIKTFVPATLPLGYYSPAMVSDGTNRVGPIRKGVNAYTSGATPLLSAYQRPGGSTALLSGARSREAVTAFR
jgi:hypothetical protein